MNKANDKKNFITHGRHGEPARFSRQTFLEQCSLTTIDKESLKLIQVLHLHKAIDHTQSSTGSALLLKSLVQPLSDLGHIQSKQESLSEIASNEKLRRALKDYVHEYSKGESTLYKFFNKGLRASFPYPDINKAKKAATDMIRILPTIPRVESSYLKTLISDLHSYGGSSIDQMMKGSIYKTFTGMKSDKEVGFFTPKLQFIPRRFTKWILAGPVVAFIPYLNEKAGLQLSITPFMQGIGLALTGITIFYSMFIKPIRDTENFIEPFRKKCILNDEFNRAIDAVGMIDELLSCHDFASESTHTAILPRVTDNDRHSFEATGLKGPVTAKDKTDVVPNTVRMNQAKLTFLSGPNSGGKTTLCKTIVHNQLLAQMGSYVLAENANINIADRIHYQAPKFDGLQDDQGRFGTELARTRDIFYSTTPKSLVILDELAQGTTYEEMLHESFEILSDFHTIGNSTILVTHNHSLLDRFMDKQKGQCFMAEFKADDPTYRIIPGISRVSHAGRIAKKINFSKQDRIQYIQKNGFIY